MNPSTLNNTVMVLRLVPKPEATSGLMFGWRPRASCYLNQTPSGDVAPGGGSVQQGCPSINWWYLLMGAAIVGGVMGGKRK